MLFTGQEVHIGKNCDLGLEYGPRQVRPWAVLKTSGTVFPYTDRPRSVNNVFTFFCFFGRWNEANWFEDCFENCL